MKRKERYIARLDEVIITREGDSAIIRYKEEGIMTTHLKIGPEISSISDEAILELFNDTLCGGNKGHPLGRMSPIRADVKSDKNFLFPRLLFFFSAGRGSLSDGSLRPRSILLFRLFDSGSGLPTREGNPFSHPSGSSSRTQVSPGVPGPIHCRGSRKTSVPNCVHSLSFER